MDKKKGWLSLLGILIAIVAGSYVCIYGVDENKSGSAAAVKQGLDLAGGVSITYEVVGEEEPSPEDMADTVYKLQKRVEVYSTEALVYQEGTKRINIEIPGVSDANSILEELGKPGSLVFMDSEGNVVLTGTEIKEAQPATQQDSMGNSEFVVALTMTEEGTEKFLQIENDVICENDFENSVIATGGSAVFGEKAMDKLKKNALTVYLQVDVSELEKRINNIHTRGIAMKEGSTRSEIFKDREELYKKYADFTLDSTHLTAEECVDEIVRKAEKFNG